nr:protein BIG GRAIN 1-like A [Ipomoea batatas]
MAHSNNETALGKLLIKESRSTSFACNGGARLTNFLNSLFANGKPKPAVKPSPEDPKLSPPPQPSTSLSSASRSCLNKTPKINNGVKKTV